jgi:hypothetical protein
MRISNLIRWIGIGINGALVVWNTDVLLEVLSLVLIIVFAFHNGVMLRQDINEEFDNANV